MGLAGDLSALGVAELLQLVAMSRKTGALEISSEDGVAWLGLLEGGIVRVALDDGRLDREAVLKAAGLESGADPAVIDAAILDAAVQTLVSVFGWTEGDFRFEQLEDPMRQWRGPEGLVLPSAVSPEFLALEGARLEDEAGLLPVPFAAEPPSESAAEPTPARDAVADEPADAPEPPEVVICVDDSLELLEQIKEAFADRPVHVHIFQSTDGALTRLKHYLVRGTYPSLVIGSEVRDPLDPRPEADCRRFVERVSRLAPRTRVVVMGAEDESAAPTDTCCLVRPDRRYATADDVAAFLRSLAVALHLAA